MMKNMLNKKLAQIKLLLTDCDGVLTDGGVYYGESGEELKKFDIRDGMGVERLRNIAGVTTGIVTGELSPSVVKRAEKLKITELHLGAKDKPAIVKEIISRLKLQPEEVLFLGDDTNDLEVMKLVGLSACPANAISFVKEVADIVCESNGGAGCFREIAELIISAHQEGKTVHRSYETITLNSGVKIAPGEPCYIIAEIGINHNGSLE